MCNDAQSALSFLTALTAIVTVVINVQYIISLDAPAQEMRTMICNSDGESIQNGSIPRRSVLYVPASNVRAIEKARTLACDAVILDLEDAVAPEMKLAAREAALAAVKNGGFGHRELVVRVNGLDTEWGAADLAALSESKANAVLVPKIRTRHDLLAYDHALNGAPAALRLWAMIETALCVFRLEEIASAVHESRLACFVMGTNDLAKELRMQLDCQRAPLLALLGLTVAAARAHGVQLLDGVYNDFEDETGFKAQCRQGVEYGFEGKTLIHPRQIEICNSAFSPSAISVGWAQRVKAAFDKPENAMKGALSVDGAMVERLHLTQAERILAIDAAIQAKRNV
jgi:citrate lyase subunit beta / citryl-CoA lyase